jgi:hypothetical protein
MDNKASAMIELINRCIRFADWAAGEGICPAPYGDPEAPSKNPDEFLSAYTEATGDEDWANVGNRIAASYEEMATAYDQQRLEIERLRKALEPFALISSEGIASQAKGYCTVTTQADYFHRAQSVVEEMSP